MILLEEIKMSEEKVIDAQVVGEKVVDETDITPSVYFDYVKGLKEKLNKVEYNIIIDSTLKMIQKCKITKQTTMAKELTHQLELAIKELEAANKGFDIFISRKAIEKYINEVEGKAIKIIELSEYTREIPDQVMDKIAEASEVFDQLYIVFTDYTKKESKRVAKERRDKDPIVFGAFLDKESTESKSSKDIYVEDRLFFVCDWVDEKCDLTLEQIVRDTTGKDNEILTYKVSNPTDMDEVKSYLNSFKEPTDKMKPVKLFDKVKKAVRKTTTRRKKKTTE